MSVGRGFVTVTPSDSVNISVDRMGRYPSALRFGTGGTAVIVAPNDTVATFTNIANGETIPVSAKRVNVSGSTGVAGIVGIYL